MVLLAVLPAMAVTQAGPDLGTEPGLHAAIVHLQHARCTNLVNGVRALLEAVLCTLMRGNHSGVQLSFSSPPEASMMASPSSALAFHLQ
jgi:hypothetical protein